MNIFCDKPLFCIFTLTAPPLAFDDFDFKYELLDGLHAMGFDHPNPTSPSHTRYSEQQRPDCLRPNEYR